MNEEFYLLTNLIEMQDCVSDGHTLFYNKQDALNAMATEIKECQEFFPNQQGEIILDLPCCREWRNEDGYGYTVTVEVIAPKRTIK